MVRVMSVEPIFLVVMFNVARFVDVVDDFTVLLMLMMVSVRVGAGKGVWV